MREKCDSNTKVSAVIVAAGKSSRMKMNTSKQFIDIENIPVLARTVQNFEICCSIDGIIVVVNEDDITFCENILKPYNFTKLKEFVAGGSQRQDSVFNGLKKTSASSEIVLIHDGARPFVTMTIIDDTINAAQKYCAAICAVPVKDTIKTVSSEQFVLETLRREELWSVQTPQGFRRDIIIKAHEEAVLDGFLGTDDSTLVERIGIKTKVVMGSYNNIKITTREDLIFARAIIDQSNDV